MNVDALTQTIRQQATPVFLFRLHPADATPCIESLTLAGADWVAVHLRDHQGVVFQANLYASNKVRGYHGRQLTPEEAAVQMATWLRCRHEGEWEASPRWQALLASAGEALVPTRSRAEAL